jgi:hypothetical protein
VKLYYTLQNSDMEMVKVSETPGRPRYHCTECDKDFPSALDLEEHMKIDHSAAVSTA